MKTRRRPSWTMCALTAAMSAAVLGAAPAMAEMPMTTTDTRTYDARWREPLDRAEAALSQGEARRAEVAWEEAQRVAMRPSLPPGGLVDVGLAYLRIGEAAHDRPTAVARARQLFLRALFRARDRRDVHTLTAVSRAFASLGDCEMAARSHAVALRFAPPLPPASPPCDRPAAPPQPAASPPSNAAAR